MSQQKTISHIDYLPSTSGKFKQEKSSPYIHRLRIHYAVSRLTLWSFLFLIFIICFFFLSPPSSSASPRRALGGDSWGGHNWEKKVSRSAQKRSSSGHTVLVTGAIGFVGTHVSIALKRRGDGVLGLDNFIDYYDPQLKRARRKLLDRAGVLP